MPFRWILARSPARTILILASIPVLGWMAYWPLRLAWADHLSRATDAATVARAVRLSAGDADLRLKLAAAQQAAGGDPTAALQAAADLDPGNVEAWIGLGLAAELRGDKRAAERALLDAARVSRQFAPRWALANYYFRRGNAARFWHWVHDALAMGYGDMRPVFRLCWNMSQDAGLILELAIPDRRAVLNQYCTFLMEEGRLAASQQTAAKLAARATTADEPVLNSWCNWQIDKGSAGAVLKVWNMLCGRRVLPYAPLDRDRAPLTDGEFAAPATGAGFSWRMPAVAGVTTGRNLSPRYFWVSFNGDQPESCVPLFQAAPVTAGARYRLGSEYHTSELPIASGLRWRVVDAQTGAGLAEDPAWLSSPDWANAEVRFTAPADGLVLVILSYRRVAGAKRVEGSLELRRVSLERVP